MKLFFKSLVSLLFIPFFILIIYSNLSLFYQPQTETIEGHTVNKEVIRQLRFLRNALRQGAGSDMQELFPEGFVFMHALYGLTWCELVRPIDPKSQLYQEAVREIDWACNEVLSETARSTFHRELSPSYGAFYAGWSNYLLGSKLQVLQPFSRDTSDIRHFVSRCDEIAALRQTPYPESYPRAAWPADAVLCVATLALHDRLFPPRYEPTLRQWVQSVESRLDADTGLIPHSVDHRSGSMLQGARGSSQSLMLCFLPGIDSTFARRQFRVYQSQFLDTCLGFPGIREYARGNLGKGDVDSGPLIFGMGAAATIVGIRTMKTYREVSIAQRIQASIEAFSFPIQNRESKRYMLGKLPIVDAFIAWTSVGPAALKSENPMPTSNYWRLPFQMLSLCLLGLISLLLFRMWN